jgi:hypothetical protein
LTSTILHVDLDADLPHVENGQLDDSAPINANCARNGFNPQERTAKFMERVSRDRKPPFSRCHFRSRHEVTLVLNPELAAGFNTLLETEKDSEAPEQIVKRRAILWDMAVSEQIRYEVATIKKTMVILGRLSSFFYEEDPDTGKRLAELGAHLADVIELVQDTWKASAPETDRKNHVSIV